MPKSALAALAAALTIVTGAARCCAVPAQTQLTWTHLGEEFVIDKATSIPDLIAHPDLYYNRQVRIEGIVASACTNEGCFIEVVPETGGDGVVVSFPELVHLFPTDAAGSHAVVEGMFYNKVYPAARLAHWQGHSFRAGRPVPEFSLIHRITARAVSLSGEKVPIPTALDMPPAGTDRLDLATVEFEAEGFGDSTETHSTGDNREMIFCLDGTVTVFLSERDPVELHSGEMSYIPPETQHGIRNLSDQPAAYLFVYSRAPEPSGGTEAHEH
jgi:quercetin dioxygenase-like cupin family protein